jgi:histidinol-phosphate phosphatase family protein
MTQADLDQIHDQMQRALTNEHAAFDAIYACTCLSTDPDCTCRKPSPEMIHRAAAEHHLDLTRSLLVGDYDRDIQMAIHAGLPTTIRILADDHPATVPATHTLPGTDTLASLLDTLLP